jgi:hypothetical protein
MLRRDRSAFVQGYGARSSATPATLFKSRRSEVSLLRAKAATAAARGRRSWGAADPFDKLSQPSRATASQGTGSAAATTLLAPPKRCEGRTAGFLGKLGWEHIKTLNGDKSPKNFYGKISV